ncbi:MAG: protein-glutamate O-methyltransferase CheR [Verrucomicrobia bacterium]|nr:protein-glutamate O-methyltransferase CheR [Verrucomicrobiota bacterium]MBI3869062.1 protein-glutamate O-methyltransferase CheR [Verrucomicrobiota bacterium]
MQEITNEASALEYIVHSIYEKSRIRLQDGKQSLIKARLGKRMRKTGYEKLSDYAEFLRTKAGDEEWTMVVDALTTNFTNFLREEDHFQFLVKHAIPSMLSPGQSRFQVWSAACSTGEEPYTIAFYLSEKFPLTEQWSWNITASDISTKVLAAARQAIYTQEKVETIPQDWRRRYLQMGQGEWEGHYRVKPAIAERVRFQQVNLIENYRHPEPFEVVFCRNVMIYFDRPTQEALVQRLCKFIKPGGYLLIGHSESLNGLKVPLRCLKPSIYQVS